MPVPPPTAENAAVDVDAPSPPSAGGPGGGPVRPTLPGWWPWGAGLLLGLVVLGPGLGGGSLLSLDLLVTPSIPIPNGIFGLGPALSQRVPLFAFLGMGSWLLGGPVTLKVAVVVWSSAAFAGAARLVRLVAPEGWGGPVAQLAAGLLWAGGPYALTRLSAGHVNLLYAIAVLPWALPHLCRPTRSLPVTFLAATALAVGGPGGGTLGITIVAVALVVGTAPRRWPAPLAVVAGANLLWVAPTAVLLWAGAGVTGAGGFATHVDGVWSWLGLAAGDGFWRPDVQAGATGVAGGLGGLALAGLASVGTVVVWRGRGTSRPAEAAGEGTGERWLGRAWTRVGAVVSLVGLALAAASAVPGVRGAYRWASDLSVGAPLRESHRFTALWLVWAAPAAALGAEAVGRSVLARTRRVAGRRADGRAAAAAGGPPAAWAGTAGAAAVVALALGLSVPGWWGLDGRLEPVTYPRGWAAARAVIDGAPGTTVAFPWSEYPPLAFAGGRQVFNPLPDYLGGDVISSYDPVFDPKVPSQEQVDRRAEVADHLSDEALAGRAIGPRLARLGVRWVALAHNRGWERYASLDTEPGLRPALSTPDLDLYEVVGWRGPAVDRSGRAHRLDRPIPPILTTDAPAGSVLDVAGAPGWVQGWGTPVDVTADGRLRLRGGAGVLWFWPAPVLLALDASVLAAALRAALKVRAARSM
jgi:hypothetical protein